MANRRKPSAEYRTASVKLVKSSDRPTTQVASDIRVVERTLGAWVRPTKEKHPEAGAA